MKDKNKKFKIKAAAVVLLCFSLFHCKEIRKTCVIGASDGALSRREETTGVFPAGYAGKNAYMRKMETILESMTGKKPEKLISVGHQVGNFEIYPKFPGEIKDKDFDAVSEMFFSYRKLGFDGIELDVQQGPGANAVYIMHERIVDEYPKPDHEWKAVKPFYEKNSLERLLADFVRKKLYKEGKHVYVELKARGSYLLDPLEEKTVEETMKTVAGLSQNHPDAAGIREKIAFISFNHSALLKAMNYADSSGYRFYYIAVSDLPESRFYTHILCPEFNDAAYIFIQERGKAFYKELWDMLNTEKRLTGIWLLPTAIQEPAAQLSLLNDRRQKHIGKDFTLEFFLSTYQVTHEKFFRSVDLPSHQGKYDNYYGRIRGLVFDVKRE